MSEHFGKRIRALREAKRWSQPELAKMVNVSGTIIGRYERGDATPPVDTAKRIAAVLGVTLDYLVSEDGEADPMHDKAAYARCRELARLPDEDKQHAYYVIDSIIKNVKSRLAYAS